ncbi:hypothetical protein Taro_025963 [Colocasia esculenta]|uniref:Transmembrane protein n=1 Tax=Colocasia esculenta TaxID=4460 RepID=A0A843VA78_COLES|nr:hypothetical protein [Colocasia esculenta]
MEDTCRQVQVRCSWSSSAHLGVCVTLRLREPACGMAFTGAGLLPMESVEGVSALLAAPLLLGSCGGVLVAEELWNDHKKLFFFPFSSAATCTNCPLEVHQRSTLCQYKAVLDRNPRTCPFSVDLRCRPCEGDGPIGRVLRSCRDSIDRRVLKAMKRSVATLLPDLTASSRSSHHPVASWSRPVATLTGHRVPVLERFGLCCLEPGCIVLYLGWLLVLVVTMCCAMCLFVRFVRHFTSLFGVGGIEHSASGTLCVGLCLVALPLLLWGGYFALSK